MEAMAKQSYDGLMNYGEDDFVASVSSEHKLTKQRLDDMGLTLLSDAKPKLPTDKVQVKGKRKTAMRLDSFAVPSQLYMRQVDVQAAQAMAVFLRDMMGNPIIAPAIGADQALIVANEIARLAGLPMPKPLTNTGAVQQNADEQNKQIMDAVMTNVMKMVKEGSQPILEAIKTNELLVINLYKALNVPIPNVTEQSPTATPAESVGNSELAATT